MHLQTVEISNIRSLVALKWDMGSRGDPTGWHVILGDNGAGKSSLLRAIALALVGPVDAAALRQSWGDCLRHESQQATIAVSIDYDPKYDWFSGGGKLLKNYYCAAGIRLLRQSDGTVAWSAMRTNIDPNRNVWGTGGGWFSASYGPFRRFGG